jgi:hypothetical protein
MPDKKRPKYLTISDKRSQSAYNESIIKSNLSTNDKICVISDVEGNKNDDLQSSIIDQQTSTQQSDSNAKVPIFVLHPSGTHYIPMCVDASVVSHGFKKNSNLSHSTTTTDQAQYHPVSIPVNFNPFTTPSDSYELEIQNINVIGTRHQTSVRPN